MLLSSDPQNNILPLRDNAHDVKPLFAGGLYWAICWSDLKSNIRADLSSDPVAKACPLG